MTFDEYWVIEWKENSMPTIINQAMKELAQRAWQAAVLAEREACAKLCESMILQSATRAEAHSQAQGNGVAIDCANAIRARK